jgi:hypothetical protein
MTLMPNPSSVCGPSPLRRIILPVVHPEVYPAQIGNLPHDSVEGIDIPNKVSLPEQKLNFQKRGRTGK